MLTPETLVRHELAGLSVRVVDATHEGYVGIEGTVVDETANTLLVGTEDGSGVRQVPKAAATFEFAVPDDPEGTDAGEADVSYVVVEGTRLVARPARRTELTGDSKWR